MKMKDVLRVVTLALLAACVALGGGCVKKKGAKLPAGGDPGTLEGQLYDELGNPILGWDENGNPIYPEGFDPGARGENEYGMGMFEPLYFSYDNAQIDPAEQGKLQTVAAYLNQHPEAGLIVEGHCDERGSNEYNLSLSERRALAVRAALVGMGLDGNRITTRGCGEEVPAAAGHDESSWSLNRRAEFVLQ